MGLSDLDGFLTGKYRPEDSLPTSERAEDAAVYLTESGYSALLSREFHHLLTVEHRWTTRRYASWVTDLLDDDLLG